MRTLHRTGIVAAAGLLLSGCSLFGGHHATAMNGGQDAEMATAEAIAEIQLEVGRENLADGNLATATRYLQGARMHPATRADATNALGVVYVRLGRLDVAQRYFLEALEVEPENARFATNLARLEGDVSFARMRASDPVEDAVSEEALASLLTAAVPDLPEVRVEAESNRQPHVIHIQTAENVENGPPRMEVYARRPVVQVVDREQAQDERPDTERGFSRAKIIDYPVRIEI